MEEIKVDPRIKIKVVPDGEVHFEFSWTLDDLSQFAMAFLAMEEGIAKEGDIKGVFRLRSKEAVDYLIQELTRARKEM